VETLRPGTIFRDVEMPWCPEMVAIPQGEFLMGSSDAERQWVIAHGARREWVQSERPQHHVAIRSWLAVGRYPVTFDEYDHFAAATGRRQPSDRDWGRGRRPVIDVSWEDATAYARWLSARTCQPYRLLSEAEWEYAARAGTTTYYWWGDEITPADANYGNNLTRTAEVGSYPPNPWGLYDTQGNVWEWVEDCWSADYDGAPDDGSVRVSGDCSRRVVRGGSWSFDPWFLRSAFRVWSIAYHRSDGCGFRLARTLTLAKAT
jgi:formylglycine-generating enzyme required for sulfatase activity